jgi:hypothetical protein
LAHQDAVSGGRQPSHLKKVFGVVWTTPGASKTQIDAIDFTSARPQSAFHSSDERCSRVFQKQPARSRCSQTLLLNAGLWGVLLAARNVSGFLWRYAAVGRHTCHTALYGANNSGKMRAIEVKKCSYFTSANIGIGMQDANSINMISGADLSEIIDQKIEHSLAEVVFDYIENMASQLAMMATGSDHHFLSYLLNLASTEAEARKSQCQRRT